MYGLPVGTDLSALRGCRLDQVAVGRYQVILHFSEHNSITVEGDIAVTGPDGRRTVFDRPIPAAAVLAERLSAEVMDAVVAQPGTVSLTLSDGFRIDVHDSNDGYESYSLNLGDRLVIV